MAKYEVLFTKRNEKKKYKKLDDSNYRENCFELSKFELKEVDCNCREFIESYQPDELCSLTYRIRLGAAR